MRLSWEMDLTHWTALSLFLLCASGRQAGSARKTKTDPGLGFEAIFVAVHSWKAQEAQIL